MFDIFLNSLFLIFTLQHHAFQPCVSYIRCISKCIPRRTSELLAMDLRCQTPFSAIDSWRCHQYCAFIFHRYSMYIQIVCYIYIYTSIHRSIHPSIHLLIDPSIQLSIYPSIHRSIDPSIYLSIDPSIHRSIDRSIHPSIHPSV